MVGCEQCPGSRKSAESHVSSCIRDRIAAGDSSGETPCKGQKSMLSELSSILYGDPVVLGIDRIHLLKWNWSVFDSRMTNLMRRALIKEYKYNLQW